MAKKSMVARERKRKQTVDKYAAQRSELKAIIKAPGSDQEQRERAQRKLQQLPRDASPCRGRNRCRVSGRPHGYFRKFGLSRNKLREATMQGLVPGLRKASW